MEGAIHAIRGEMNHQLTTLLVRHQSHNQPLSDCHQDLLSHMKHILAQEADAKQVIYHKLITLLCKWT